MRDFFFLFFYLFFFSILLFTHIAFSTSIWCTVKTEIKAVLKWQALQAEMAPFKSWRLHQIHFTLIKYLLTDFNFVTLEKASHIGRAGRVEKMAR